MLSGADISNFQGQINWPTFKDNVNFVIIKMTEGSNYIDTWGANNRTQARLFNLPRGYYHFARPDLNTPESEASFFIDVMNGQPLQEGESVYLDYEVQYSGDNVAWVLKWMNLVEQALGVKPVFYSYQSMLTSHDWQPVVNNGNGLWVATANNDPNNDNFETGAWPFAMMNQWGNQDIPGVNTGVVDSDVFYGDKDAFLAYGYKKPQPEVNPSTPVVEVPDMLTPTPTPPSVPSSSIDNSVINQNDVAPHVSNFPTFIKWLEALIAQLKKM
jgi:lysozyme